MTLPDGQTRARGGRFAARFTPHELLTIAREISSQVATTAGIDPLEVTQAAYDTALASSQYAGSPRAFRIAARLKTTWRRVLEVAHLQGRQFDQSLAALLRRGIQMPSEKQACRAVSAIATRLGVDTIRPNAYDAELDRLIEEQRRAWLHGVPIEDVFPSAARIDATFGWTRILKRAGLKPLDHAGAMIGEQRKGRWTCEGCVQSVITALDEQARSAPGKQLGQSAYKALQKGRRDLAPMSTITIRAKRMGTSFVAIRAELVTWRLGNRVSPPAVLDLARVTDATWKRNVKPPLAAARRVQAEFTARWETDLFAAMDELGRPARLNEIAEAVGWTGRLTSKRLKSASDRGKVEMTYTGRGTRSVRWTLISRGAVALPASDECPSRPSELL